jgi:DNA polymerase-3 subunit epsilon
MENVETYIAFDLEFNTVDGVSHIIQVSAVKMDRHEEVGQFDSFVYSDVPLQSFINGLTGITADKIAKAPKLESVLADFKAFVGDTPLIGYNALKSDLPILAENGLDLEEKYVLDVFDEAFDRRASDLNGIVNLKLTSVADFFGIKGHGHNSLEDARMTAQIYEKFLELDENAKLLEQQEEVSNNPFAALGLGSPFRLKLYKSCKGCKE